MKPHIIPLLLLGCALPLWAEKNAVEYMRWYGPDRTGLLIIIGMVLVTLGVLVGIYWQRVTMRRRENNEYSFKQFNDTAARLLLTNDEINLLKKLLHHEPNLQPHIVFQSISFFERSVDLEVRSLAGSSVPAALLERTDVLLASLRKKLGFNTLPLEHPLISTRNLTVGQAGSIFGRSNRTPLVQKARVVDINEFSLKIGFDTEHEEPFQIARGNRVRFVFARQSDGVYGILLTAVSVAPQQGLLEFYHTMEIRRNQLRQYVRIEVLLPLKVRLIATVNPETSEIKKGAMVECRMVDISGGGMSFTSDHSLKPGDTVSLQFALSLGAFAGIGAKIIRVSLQDGKSTTMYKHHVQFADIEPKKRDLIVRFVFEKQRQINQYR